MKKIFSLMILTILCLSLVSADSGNIQISKDNCNSSGNDPQLNVGDKVYISGNNKFAGGSYNWSIISKDGYSNPVPSANFIVTDQTAFCLDTNYTIKESDYCKYDVSFGDNKNKVYHVSPCTTTVVPEFGAVVGVLTILSALGVFFVIRRR